MNLLRDTYQTSINVETITGFSSPIPSTPIMKIDDKSSLGTRETGDCKRTACSRCDSSSCRCLIKDAIFLSSDVMASRKWVIDTFCMFRGCRASPLLDAPFVRDANGLQCLAECFLPLMRKGFVGRHGGAVDIKLGHSK